MPLTAEGLGHEYRRGEPGMSRALSGIELNIEAGEMALVAGANGSGKTTLLQCLSGLLRPTKGRVTIDGANAVKAHGAAAMSVQFPERALFAPTVHDDVAFGPRNAGLDEAAVKERVLSAIKAVGLGEELLACHPRALSHGQRRLAALAGAIAVGPRYLFLDEPTAGLDSMGRGCVLKALTELNRAGMAIIVASHDLERLMGACRRVLVLENGKIIFDGTPDEMAARDDVCSAGLALPPSMAAARWLRRKGIDAPWDVSPEEAAAHMRRLRHESVD